MKIWFFALFFFALVIAGCLQEKEIAVGAVPTASIIPSAGNGGVILPTVSSSTPTPTIAPTIHGSTPTATPSSSASAASCTVYTAGDVNTFKMNADATFVVNFQNLPDSVQYANVKCNTGETPSSELIKKKTSGINVPKTCVYKFPGNVIFTATAGGASCEKIVNVIS